MKLLLIILSITFINNILLIGMENDKDSADDIYLIYRLNALANNIRLCSCGKRFYTSENIKKHIKNRHQLVPSVAIMNSYFICKECSQLFGSLNRMLLHFPEHTKEILYNCVDCQQSFSDYFGTKKHIILHMTLEKNEKAVLNDTEKENVEEVHRDKRPRIDSYSSPSDLEKLIYSEQSAQTFCSESIYEIITNGPTSSHSPQRIQKLPSLPPSCSVNSVDPRNAILCLYEEVQRARRINAQKIDHLPIKISRNSKWIICSPTAEGKLNTKVRFWSIGGDASPQIDCLRSDLSIKPQDHLQGSVNPSTKPRYISRDYSKPATNNFYNNKENEIAKAKEEEEIEGILAQNDLELEAFDDPSTIITALYTIRDSIGNQ